MALTAVFTRTATRAPGRRRRRVAVLAAAVLAVGLVPSVTTASAAPAPEDPRVGLAPDEEAISNLEKLSSSPLAFGPNSINSDLAFSGDYAVSGSFAGITFYDISDPEAPVAVTSFLCPGAQNDVSVHGDLLFVSVEEGGTTSCVPFDPEAAPGTPEADEFRGVRILDISDVTRPRQVAAVPTCRGSHTHTLVESPADASRVWVYVSGTSLARPTQGLTTCGPVASEEALPEPGPDSPYWRVDVIEVPLDAPETAAVVSGPRVFADRRTGAVNGLQNEPPAPTHPSGEEWFPEPVTRSCHDITAYAEIGLAAGACEGNGILLDIRDPANPRRVAEVSDPNFAYWHSATFNNDGTKVIFTDEWGGGVVPHCLATDREEWGADAIFDVVRDRRGRVSLSFASYYKLPAPQSELENCVAHNGSLLPVPGRDILVQAWYQGGTSVVDFTDSRNPVEIAYFDRGPFLTPEGEPGLAGYWSTYWHNGEVYGNEIDRGFDAFALTASDHLSDLEIAAAEQVVVDETNVQGQERIVWPASFTTVRAWQSAAERQGALDRRERRAVTRLVEQAERLEAAGLDRLAALLLQVAAASVGRTSVEQGLAGALRELADDVRGSAAAAG